LRLQKEKKKNTQRRLKIIGWIIYLSGVPAWVIILIGKHDWIAASIEAGGIPAMLFVGKEHRIWLVVFYAHEWKYGFIDVDSGQANFSSSTGSFAVFCNLWLHSFN